MSISIHAPSRERPLLLDGASVTVTISIHAPSRERPSYALALLLRGLISIHAPSRERREPIEGLTIGVSGFQSTLPHGSDSSVCLFCARHTDFNPRSLTGATERQNVAPCVIYISIHAPSRERRKSKTCVLNNCYFNPRSLTGATMHHSIFSWCRIISIHAPSRERRRLRLPYSPQHKFQSTLPHGSDLVIIFSALRRWNFNPRSLTGATLTDSHSIILLGISIHAPSRERRLPSHQSRCRTNYFNPRSLTGATTC